MSKSLYSFFALPAPDLAHILRGAAKDFEELRSKRIFITGGTGFFGKWMLAGLLSANDELGLDLKITILSRNPSAFQSMFPEVDHPAVRFEGGDVALFPTEHRRFDYLIHAATDTTAFTTVKEEESRARTIVDGTRRMLELAQRSGARRFLNISSGAVYGAFTSQPTGANEHDYAAAVPLTPYAEAKRAAEELCAASDIDFVTARAFAFLGPHLPLDAHFAAGNFLRDARRGGPIFVRGDGTALRSYLHPSDLIVWLMRMLIRGQRGRAYNVGSDEHVTVGQLAHRIAAVARPQPEVIIQGAQAAGPQNIYLPDVQRARSELGLDVAIPLDDAIARTLAFLAREI